ncbi:MAG: hypothetical protein ACXVB9_07575 [Bdellovibrionota bacterium]
MKSKKKPAPARRKRPALKKARPGERGAFSPFDPQVGYFVLMGAILAILFSFHAAHERLVQSGKSPAQASLHELEMGR